ncbi:MAG TPA: YkgJ family cysteine cluster protein [Candidatus Sulfopaludibacter sp.]|nr:YkgJ family cysteine cluster protein [Candidatus Sulfopaludibacter sp.]
MDKIIDALCLQCGLCCNGVLFADVRPEPGDASPLFHGGRARMTQPCPAFNAETCACAIYAERPARCRKFECRQLLGVRTGTTTTQDALGQIRTARELAARVEKLLAELDFNNVRLPLSRRFQRCQRAAENGELPQAQFDRLADLQLAVHQLTGLLAREFYA